MPLHLPFNFPYFYNNRNYRRLPQYYNNTHFQNNFKDKYNFQENLNHNMKNKIHESKLNDSKKNPENSENENCPETSECFFEIFGIKLHFDDVLIICILFFLYKEEVKDQELFLCLILLLIS